MNKVIPRREGKWIRICEIERGVLDVWQGDSIGDEFRRGISISKQEALVLAELLEEWAAEDFDEDY